jgi:hypothetical protein
VRVLQLVAAGTRSQLVQRARLHTEDTTMLMPPGILLPGNLYVLTIAAIGGGSPVTQVNRNALPFVFTTTMSAIVAP